MIDIHFFRYGTSDFMYHVSFRDTDTSIIYEAMDNAKIIDDFKDKVSAYNHYPTALKRLIEEGAKAMRKQVKVIKEIDA